MARGISKTNFKTKINITIWLPGIVVSHLREDEDIENYSRFIEQLIYEAKPQWKKEVENAPRRKSDGK